MKKKNCEDMVMTLTPELSQEKQRECYIKMRAITNSVVNCWSNPFLS